MANSFSEMQKNDHCIGFGINKNSSLSSESDNAITPLINVENSENIPDFNRKGIIIPELLFGDYTNAAIIAGNTNKLLLAQNGGKRKMSNYIRDANKISRRILKSLNPKNPIKTLDYREKDTNFTRYENLLILGGPVASKLTKSLCGYEDRKIMKQQIEGEPTEVPIFTNRLPFKYYGSPNIFVKPLF